MLGFGRDSARSRDRPFGEQAIGAKSIGPPWVAWFRSNLELTTLLALTGLGWIFLWIYLPQAYWGDGQVRGDNLLKLLETGQLTPSRYSYIGPLFSTPLALLDRFAAEPGDLFRRYNHILFAGYAVAALLALWRRVDRVFLARLLLLALTCSMFPYHLRTFYGETFSALGIAVGLTLVCFERPVLGWALAIVAAANTPALGPSLALVAAAVAWSRRDWRHLIPVAVAASLVLLESWLVRGSPFTNGYEDLVDGAPGVLPYTGKIGFSYPLFFGVLSLLFSFGRGLAFFTPGLWLTLWPTRPAANDALGRAAWLWVLFVCGELVTYGRWSMWHGAGFWGPRFLLLASLPASYFLALRLGDTARGLWANLGTLLLLVFSWWVGVSSAVFELRGLDDAFCDATAEGAVCLYVPEFSPLWRPFVVPHPLSLNDRRLLVYLAVVLLVLALPVLRALWPRRGAVGPQPPRSGALTQS